jgi:hypothetical protein
MSGDRDPVEEWNALADLAGEAEIDHVLALSPAQRDEELRKAGFDVDARRKAAEAQRDAAISGNARGPAKSGTATTALTAGKVSTKAATPASNVVELPRRPSRWWISLAVAAAIGALVATEGSSIVAWFTGDGDSNQRVTHGQDPVDAARRLRSAAQEAVAAGAWERALDLLDRAKDMDPEGDAAPKVQEARRRVKEALNPGTPSNGGPKAPQR